MPGCPKRALRRTFNLTLLFRLQQAMQEYTVPDDIEYPVEEFSLAGRAARIAEITRSEIWIQRDENGRKRWPLRSAAQPNNDQ